MLLPALMAAGVLAPATEVGPRRRATTIRPAPPCRRCPRRPSVPPATAAAPRSRAGSRRRVGPTSTTAEGRIVFFHGVDAVYKYAPYELYPDPKKPWNFSSADASLMARLGFNVVRLGMTWSGLEPGTAPANDPAICDARRADEPAPVQPSRPRPLHRQPHQDRRPAGSLPHLHDPGHAPGRVQRDLRG